MSDKLEKILMAFGLWGLLGAVSYGAVEPDMATLLIISFLVLTNL